MLRRRIERLSHEDLTGLVLGIAQALYLDYDDGFVWNPHRDWNGDTLERIDGLMAERGLRPSRRMPER